MLETLNMNAVIDVLLKKEQTLNLELLNKITDSGTTTYDLVRILCNYINATDVVKRGEDLKRYCELVQHVKELKSKATHLEGKYGESITEILTLKQTESELKTKLTTVELENMRLKAKLEDFEEKKHLFEILRN